LPAETFVLMVSVRVPPAEEPTSVAPRHRNRSRSAFSLQVNVAWRDPPPLIDSATTRQGLTNVPSLHVDSVPVIDPVKVSVLVPAVDGGAPDVSVGVVPPGEVICNVKFAVMVPAKYVTRSSYVPAETVACTDSVWLKPLEYVTSDPSRHNDKSKSAPSPHVRLADNVPVVLIVNVAIRHGFTKAPSLQVASAALMAPVSVVCPVGVGVGVGAGVGMGVGAGVGDGVTVPPTVSVISLDGPLVPHAFLALTRT
jgi:hypothetical protein